MASRPRISTAARVTIVAGLIGTLLACGFAYWMRQEIYTSRYEALKLQAFRAHQGLVQDVQIRNAASPDQPFFDLPPGAGNEEVYEITTSTGHVVAAHGLLRAFSSVDPVAPTPLPGERSHWDGGHYVTFGPADDDGTRDICSPQPTCPEVGMTAGRRVEVYRTVKPVRFVNASPRLRSRLDPDLTVGITVFVLPREAEQAVAEVDRVLKPAVPLAVLLIMVGAYAGTRAALRPVERMRAQAAAISQRNLHERVPVPATGDVLARLGTTLNDTLARLEAAAERQRGFVADAAHELRSPIASVRAILEVASEHPERADWAQVGQVAVEEVRRLQEIADDLLLVARLDAESETVRTPVDLAELVRRQLARRVDEGPEVSLDAAESVTVSGDAGQLDRLVRNLVDNAMRHARTTVSVSIGQEDGQVTLHVDDDGAGIPAQDRERVFERFTRLDEARSRDAGGVGLGLAIAREIALRHGGTLRAGESPGGGARFTLVLEEA